MTTRPSLLLIVALALPGALFGGEPEEARPRMAVLRPSNPAAVEWWNATLSAGERAQDLLIATLAGNRRYEVLGRAELADRLAEEKIWLIGELTPGGAVKLSRQLGVRYVAATTLVEFGTGAEGPLGRRKRKLFGLGGRKSFRVEVRLRVFDGETGASVWSDGRSADAPRRKPADVAADEVPEAARVFEQTLLPLLQELAGSLAAATLGESAPAGEPTGWPER